MEKTIRTRGRADTRTRIIAAAALLQHDGPAAVTTRAVADGAGVQAPAIYRLFGDKDGLLEAVAEHAMSEFVASKAAIVEAATSDNVDPLDDLRSGWRNQIEFGLGNPVLFSLLSDPGRAESSPAAQRGRRILEARVHRVAAAGRLRVSENRAVGIIQAAGTGAIQTLLATPPDLRDHGLPDSMYDAVLNQILTDATGPVSDDRLTTTVAFRAVVPQLDALTAGERQVLLEWLDRAIADS
ncbi:TetR/AcrR family transcriptional regulator [Agreia sp.]|uniref:TetR/AcrR family transcriptional regulator n=1 Tax=Agreia sp. TaxID=1872416 RepID=UPI0035BC6479